MNKFCTDRDSRRWLIFLVLSAIFWVAAIFLSKQLPVLVKISAPYVVDGLSTGGGDPAVYRIHTQRKFAILGFPVSLKADTRYQVCLPILSNQGGVVVTLDFAGTGYDGLDQEYKFTPEVLDFSRNYCFVTDSDRPPSDTGLRVMVDRFDDSENSIEFGKPAVYEIRFPFLHQLLNLCVKFGFFVVLFSLLFISFRSISLARVRSGVLRSKWLAKALLGILLLTGVWQTLWIAFSSPYPWVFADEYSYAWLIKHSGDLAGAARVGLVSTIAHSSLYFKVFEPVFSGHADPYVLNKVINTFLWFLTAALGFLTARKFFGNLISAYFSALVLVGPWVIYTRVMMPETMYFLGVMLTVCLLVWTWREDIVIGEVIAGFCLVALSFVKSHAVILLPAVALAGVSGHFVSDVSLRKRSIRIAYSLAAVIGSWVIGKSVLAFFLLNGDTGSLLAGGYGGEMSRILHLLGDIGARYRDVVSVSVRHVTFVAVSAGPALILLAIYLHKALSAKRRIGADGVTSVIRPVEMVFVSMVASSLLIAMTVTIVFTVSAAGVGVYETLDRVHTRYYGFILPLVILAGSLMGSRGDFAGSSRGLWIGAILVLILAAAGFWSVRWLNANDGPDAIFSVSPWTYGAVFLSMLVALSLILFRGRVDKAVILISLGIFVALSNQIVYRKVFFPLTSAASAGDQIGLRILFEVPLADRDAGLVVAKDKSLELYRVMFYINSNAPVIINRSAEDLDFVGLQNVGVKWVLMLGYSDLNMPGWVRQDLGSNFSLYRGIGNP